MKIAILSCLIISALLLAIAPFFIGLGYNWLRDTTSESAAQNSPNAWIARAGFAFYAIGIFIFSFSAPPPNNFRYLPFAISMIFVATWSTAPIFDGHRYDPIENFLHSVGANFVGISFILAVISSQFAEQRRSKIVRAFDLLAILVSILIPLVMGRMYSVRGLTQRLMFLISYTWFAMEVFINQPEKWVVVQKDKIEDSSNSHH